MSFREGDVGSNPARVETEMSPKDQGPGDLLDGNQLELLLKAPEMSNLSHHDPPRPLTSIHDATARVRGHRGLARATLQFINLNTE